MKIKKVEIKGLFGKKDIEWELNPQVNVLVGENGSGKSTILSIIYCMLNNIPNSNKNMIFELAKIQTSNNKIDPIIRRNRSLPQFIDIQEIIEGMTTQIEKVISKELKGKKPKNLKNLLSQQIQAKIMNDVQDIDGKKALMVYETEQYAENQEIFDAFNITMISTLNLSANAIFEFKGSNEEMLNILDLEMNKTIHQFSLKENNAQISEKLINSLNFFLNMIGKYAKYENNSIRYFDTDKQQELNFSNLSSGERQLIYMLVQVALNATEVEKSSIILMDEPEISLHLDWQAIFIKQLTLLNPNAQFIIVTHSPGIIMDGWNDVYMDMEEISEWQ